MLHVVFEHLDRDCLEGGVDGGGGYPDFRMIRLDGQPHDPQRALQYTYMGYTVGKWEGDTLVLDSIGFTDETWLGRGGKIHSDQMHIIEKFTRTGNLMTYDVTVEDPVMFVQPWVMNQRILRIANNPTIIAERGSCWGRARRAACNTCCWRAPKPKRTCAQDDPTKRSRP